MSTNLQGHETAPMPSIDDQFRQALSLHEQGKFIEAENIYQQILSQSPEHAWVLHSLGVLEIQRHHPEKAIVYFDLAVSFNKDDPTFFSNRGVALQELGRYADAIESFDTAIAIHPEYGDAYMNRGIALQHLKQYEQALSSYDKALVLKPNAIKIYTNRGNTLSAMGRHQEALMDFDYALKISPNAAEVYVNRGNVLRDISRLEEAMHNYQRAIELNPGIMVAYMNLGNIMRDLSRFDEACMCYEAALSMQPYSTDALWNLSIALRDKFDYERVIDVLSKIYQINPQFKFIQGELIHIKMLCCQWDNFDAAVHTMEDAIAQGQPVASPFGYQAISMSPELLMRCAVTYCQDMFPAKPVPLAKPAPLVARKIKIGYVSGEFRHHATSSLMIELWESHDKTNFELYAFDSGWDDQSIMRARVCNAFDHMVDISGLSDFDAAHLVASHQVDILINLNGYFGKARQAMFSYRACAIQVNYLGFPGTLGADYIDYIIADACVIPEQHKKYYVEKVAYLPNCYQVNDSKRVISDTAMTRAEMGLPDDAFVFCCFNNNYKITPHVFDVWMRILQKTPDSVLWLLADNVAARNNLQKEALARGIDPKRLIFAPRVESAVHFKRHRLADLFLDTWPYNAHTTASDALWAGLPVLTVLGETFPGRVAASLLTTLGVPELISASLVDYEERAIALTKDAKELASLKEKLTQGLSTSPLFNAPLFAQHLEKIYTMMMQRQAQGLTPEHIVCENNNA